MLSVVIPSVCHNGLVFHLAELMLDHSTEDFCKPEFPTWTVPYTRGCLVGYPLLFLAGHS